MNPIDRRTLLTSALLVPGGVAAGAVLGAAPAQAVGVRLGRTLAKGLSYPWGIAFLPDSSALVTERNSGRVLHIGRDGGVSVAGRVAEAYNDGGEGGLMGLVLSPDFASDQQVFAFTTTRTDNRIVRMTYSGGVIGATTPVLTGIPSGSTHNGGGLCVTRGRSLMVTTGDTRNRALAQDKTSLAGKVLRLGFDGSARSDNPFGTRIWTFGHRNPQGIAQASDQRLWATELGENTHDELNILSAGRNYGWPQVEGRDGPGGYADPFVQWSTSECSPSGLALANGHAWVGALRGQSLWSVDIAGSGQRTRKRHLNGRLGRIRLVKRAPDGTLWVGTSNGPGRDVLIRVVIT